MTETITKAFMEDPVWSWAFPDEQRRARHYRVWWGMLVAAALEHGSAWVTGEQMAAVSIWVLPGEEELLPNDEARLEPALGEMLGSEQSARVLELVQLFDDHHPGEPPFHYLSLLATDPDHRGQSLGVGLLAQRLEVLDEAGEPALLESTNPVNHKRYRRLGFEQVDEFSAPEGGPPVAVMWRDPA